VKHDDPGTVLVVAGTVVLVLARLVVVRRVVVGRAVVGRAVVGGRDVGAATGATVVEVTGSVVGSERGGDEVLVGASALPLDEQAVAANRLARAAAEAMPSRRSHGRRRPRRLQARAITTGPTPRCAAMAGG